MQVFNLRGSKGEAGGAVAGCRVSEGAMQSAMQFRVLRDGEVRLRCFLLSCRAVWHAAASDMPPRGSSRPYLCSSWIALEHTCECRHASFRPAELIQRRLMLTITVQVVHEGRAASLKRAKQAVDTVGKGAECGLLLDGWDGCQVLFANVLTICFQGLQLCATCLFRNATSFSCIPMLRQFPNIQCELLMQAGDVIKCFTIETRAARSHEVVQQQAATG